MDDTQVDALCERLWDVMEGRSAKQPEANRNMRGNQEQVLAEEDIEVIPASLGVPCSRHSRS